MYEILLIAHLILIAMGTGMAFSHLIFLRVSSGESGQRGLALAHARRVLGDFTTMVVVFIWITGLMLVWSRYGDPDRTLNAAFYGKIGFVGLFTLAHVMQRLKAARFQGDDYPNLAKRLELWTSLAWLSALLAICLAVVSFTNS
jgi:hypothetical protein